MMDRLVGLLVLGHVLTSVAVARDKPDVIVVVWDTTRADHLTPYGYSRDTTPNLNKIAERGVVYERAYAVAPWTMPSVASIFTGLFTHNHQVDWDAKDWSLNLPESATTLGEVMKAAGYETHFLTRHAFHQHNQGFTQGFDHFESVWPGSFTQRVEAALDAAGDTPVFMLLYHLDPHSPYRPSEEHRQWATPGMELNIVGCGKERDASQDAPGSVGWCEVHRGRVELTDAQFKHLEGLYDGELRGNDVWLGNLWEMLERRGTRDETAIFFTSDHGEGFNDHPRAKVWHLHGYDSNLHVPLIAYYPPKLQPGRVSTAVRTIDLLPTVAEVAGIELTHPINGESLLPLSRSGGDDRVLTGTSHYDGAPMFYRDGKYKLMFSRAGKRWVEVYDLEADPGEHHDLAPANPSLVAQIRAKMDAFVLNTRIELVDAGKKAGQEESEMLKSLGYTDE
jgi:arylsulfatase A-like enzyme